MVLEFKVRNEGESVEQALDRAQAQPQERQYVEALRGRGAQPIASRGASRFAIYELAFVFDGKQVHARRIA